MSDILHVDKNFVVEQHPAFGSVAFYNADSEPFRIYGVFRQNGRYRRMDEDTAKRVNDGVAYLHTHTAGGRVRFRTDSEAVAIRVKMSNIDKMPHFPLTGSAGFDLYEKDGSRYFYLGSFVPPFDIKDGYEAILHTGNRRMKDLVLHMPLYAGVEQLEIGVNEGAAVCAGSEYAEALPVVTYGSSITQGGCASRPGNSYQAILSRKFDLDFINLGFSGSAHGEKIMADYLAGLDMSLFILDYDHNAVDVAELQKTHYNVYAAVRNAHPSLPILLASRPKFYLNEEEQQRLSVIKETYRKAKEAGDDNIYLLNGATLMDFAEDDGTVDGTHPNDEGFFSMAKAMGEVMKDIPFIRKASDESRYEFKLLSPLEKCFLDEGLDSHPQTDTFTVFRNERLSFQLGITDHLDDGRRVRSEIKLSGSAAPYTRVRQVQSVAVDYPTNYVGFDDDMLRQKPGLYPDVIKPLSYQGKITVTGGQTSVLWFDVELPEDFPEDETVLSITLPALSEETVLSVNIKRIGEALPEQKLIHTEWFYSDCVAEAIHADAFSEKHWQSLESFLKTAVDNGINMILTPVFTPELDTYIGGERLTTQLVRITRNGKDSYDFDFSELDRWIDLCKRCGVKYYEIPHFFTQWGAKNAPKIIARVDGEEKKIFGWETDALGEEYKAFLSQLIPSLLECLKKNGVAESCYFHVSDEPSLEKLEHYGECKEFLTRFLPEERIIDALSEYDFYEKGAIKKPVPHICSIDPFLENKVPGLWTYYCGNSRQITGRCLSMPLYRTRILGVQLWKAKIEGFLHWGYNFYHNQNSYDYVDVLSETSGEYFAAAGDAFLVYPGHDGSAMESLRLNALREAVNDMRALDLLAQKKGRAAAEEVLRQTAGGEITFRDYPHSADFFLVLRARIAQELK